MPSSVSRAAFAVLASLALVSPAASIEFLSSDENEVEARGFSAAKLYDFSGVDNVSLFTGGLTVTIPIGPTHKVDGDLSYALTLVFNSAVWTYHLVPDTAEEEDRLEGVASPLSSAGLGWMVTLGRLVPPTHPVINEDAPQWMLVSPDGGQHFLWPSLHTGEPEVPDVWYTRDSTYAKMQGDPVTGPLEVEFSDGVTHTFEPYGDFWEVVEMRDRFDNTVTVDRTLPLDWVIEDGTRVHHIRFTAGTADLPGPHVSEVELEGFDGVPALYSFTYQNQAIERGCRDRLTTNSANVFVPLLTGLELPSGEQYAMTEGGSPAYGTECFTASSYYPGTLDLLTLPTQGRIAYTWGPYDTPRFRVAGVGQVVHTIKTAGVVERRLEAPDGAPEGTRVYDNGYWPDVSQEPCNVGGPCPNATETRTVVIEPTGECTRHYFSADPSAQAPAWSFGLPFSPGTPPDAGGRFRSAEVWTGSGPPTDPDVLGLDVDCAGTVLRSTWVEYDLDPGGGGTAGTFDPARGLHNVNRRLLRSRTVYHDDNDRFADMANDPGNFDGLGHYRTTTYGGDFPGQNARTIFTDWNHDSGTYPGNFTLPSTWVLDTFERTEVTEGGHTAVAEYCFGGLGFLQRRRILSDTVAPVEQSGNDLLEVYNQDDFGNRDVERFFGGDPPAVQLQTGGVEICELSLPSSYTYRREHRYANGALRKSFYTTSGAAVPNGASIGFNSYDADIDGSGLVERVRDTSSLFGATFNYDPMGRVTLANVDSGEGADTVYTYEHATWGGSVFTPARVTVSRDDDGGPELTRTTYEYDPFGRLAREIRLMPGEEEAERTIEYDDAGRRERLSEWRPLEDPVAGETVFTYDEFGRPETVTAPDGSETSFAYAGVSQVDRTVTIETSGGPTSVTVRERYDRFGRLHSVEEPLGSGNLWTYGYDEGDRLVAVNATAPGLDPQTRTFDYDGRGFLLEECHPEKGVPTAPVGCVAYDAYDARGHTLRKSEAGRVLDFAYDKAERLLSVADTSASRALKAFTYDDGVPGTASRLDGRLRTATRHNWVDLPWDGTNNAVDVTVTETYAYDSTGGRASTRSTVLARAAPYGSTTFSQAFTWTPLGDPARLTYPTCSGVACPAGEPTLQVDHGYDAGFLTSLTNPSGTDWLTDIQYHPNGLWSRIDRSNGWRDEQSIAGNGMQRPLEIETLDGSQQVRFTTGTFAYDGAGNVTAMTPDSFDYDAHSRLVAASIDGAPYGFAYDAYGNLSSYSGPTGTVSICIDSEKNRIVELGTPGCDDLKARQDPFGNVTELQGFNYEYDALDMLIHRKPVPPPLKKDQGATVEPERTYVYTADDERIWQIQAGGPLPPLDENDPGGPEYTSAPERITLRDLAGKVLRQYDKQTAYELDPPDDVYAFPFTGTRDSIHRNGQLAATQTGTWWITHQHLDHLGTPRAISDGSGALVATHKYAPYGKEIGGSSGNALQFTGHERDSHGAGEDDNLDYMHARHYSPHLGRLLSVDPVGESANANAPQSWNRYAYAWNNPLKYIDPTGEVISLVNLSESQIDELLEALADLTGNTYGADAERNLQLLAAGQASSETATSFLDDLIASDTVFGVVASEGRNQFNAETGNVELNFASFRGAKYGRVDPRAFNLGSTLIHELHHAATGSRDLAPGGSLRLTYDWTGPAVDFVNEIRLERGLPERAAYLGRPTIFGQREKIGFRSVNPKKPEKLYYVVRERF